MYHTRKELAKYGMFDARTSMVMRRENCHDGYCCGLVRLYACMGLHRYNLLQGTNFELDYVRRYNMTLASPAATFYITLGATDPYSHKYLTFQTAVKEESCGVFVLTSYIARPRGTDCKVLEREFFRIGSFPECPNENPFGNRNRFYLVDESELQFNDWIRLYLELSVTKSDRSSKDHDLSNLKTVEVAIETTEPPSELSLTAKNATVYIRYTYFCEARCGKNFDHIAIVRRTFIEPIQ
ncbi:hypothetical protein CARUB_v10017954mg [Capsella rubella]|uniref:Uncharacterized protein n=1 Tax=Capsella rubella TaxID=81985 RepID=R0FQ52_9BRAS|nr:hypothetical protein CARUB_v10017954mg [Capsella rubella]